MVDVLHVKVGFSLVFLHVRDSDDKLIDTTLIPLFGISGNFNLRTEPRGVLVIASGTPKTQQNRMVTNNHDP